MTGEIGISIITGYGLKPPRAPWLSRKLVTAGLKQGLPLVLAREQAGRWSKAIRRGRYWPKPLEEFTDPDSGRVGLRPQRLDRIVAGAVQHQLLAETKAYLLPATAGGVLPGITPRVLLQQVCDALRVPGMAALRYDVAAFFPSVSWASALEAVARAGAGPETLELLALLAQAWGPALPLGAATSPLLATLDLRRADQQVSGFSIAHVRWIDDGILVTPEPERARQALESALRSIGLRLNENKTGIYTAPGVIPWLGLEIGFDGSISPAEAALAAAQERALPKLVPMTERQRTAHLDAVTAHWRRNSNCKLERIDSFASALLLDAPRLARGRGELSPMTQPFTFTLPCGGPAVIDEGPRPRRPFAITSGSTGGGSLRCRRPREGGEAKWLQRTVQSLGPSCSTFGTSASRTNAPPPNDGGGGGGDDVADGEEPGRLRPSRQLIVLPETGVSA